MATKKPTLKELKEKFEGLTPSKDPASEYQITLALIKKAEAEAEAVRKSAADKLAKEQAKKDAIKADKERTSDLAMLQTLEEYITKRNDLGQTVPERIQTQYNNLKKKYPDFIAKAGTQPQFGGQPSGYQNVGAQTVGVTPVTPKPGEGPKLTPTPGAGLKDSDKDGIPDSIDADPNTPYAPLTPTPTPKPKPGVKVVTPPPPADGLDTKTLWVSYLRSTFASLDDKTQKAQIDKLLEDAKTFKYDEKTFMELLKGTVWWQTTLPSMRSFFLETSDPRNASTFTEKVQNKMSTIAAKLDVLGISAMSTDPATGKLIDNSEFIKGLAMQTIQNNWDDSQLEDFIATKSNVMFTGGGTLGSTLEKVKNQAYMYGIKIDSALEKEINFSLLDPNDGRDANYWLYSMKQQAMDSPTYKPFAESLKAGRSLYEVTNNYRQQMANLLEVDSTAITWDDLMGKVVDNTTGNARTFADFTKQVKQDKLWQYTKNAKETYSNMALDLAKTFGFSG